MDEVVNTVLTAVPTVGSRTTYEAVYALVAPELRRHLPNALLKLKREGKIVKFIDAEVTPQEHVIRREAL